MATLKLVLVAIGLLGIALFGMGFKIFFTKNGTFSGGSCQHTPELDAKGITCGCGGDDACDSGNSHENELKTIPVKEYST